MKINIVDVRNERKVKNAKIGDITEDIRGATVGAGGAGGSGGDLNEIQIIVGNMENIKKRAVEMLTAFLTMENETKQSINKSYKTISERVTRSKMEEKKTITDYFKNMSNDERRVEDTLKVLKMGRWNLGLQKGVFQYDKEIYDKEHMDIIEVLNNGGVLALDDNVINPQLQTKTAEDLMKEAQDLADEEYENEALGIGHLGENYMDGFGYGDVDNGDGEDHWDEDETE
jgi:hypothetical protein